MILFFFFSSRRRHTRCSRDWSSDVCSSDLEAGWVYRHIPKNQKKAFVIIRQTEHRDRNLKALYRDLRQKVHSDRKSTRLNSSHGYISYAVFCLKKKKKKIT